jgi:hypothetical protein
VIKIRPDLDNDAVRVILKRGIANTNKHLCISTDKGADGWEERVAKVWRLAHRWRYAVVAVELALAAGCVYAGWNVMAPAATPRPLLHHGPSTPADVFGAGALGAIPPTAGAGAPPTAAAPPLGTSPKRTLEAPHLSADWLSRLNADDYDQYRGQWQTLQLLMSGLRQYLEQRVVPRLLVH